MVLGVLYHGLLVSRVVYLLAFFIALLGATGTRLLLTWLRNYLDGQDTLRQKLVIIGGERRAAEFLNHLKSHNASVIVAGSLEPNAASPAGTRGSWAPDPGRIAGDRRGFPAHPL